MIKPAPRSPAIIVLDLETTGLDARTCAPLQIGAVWLQTGSEFSMDIRYAMDFAWEQDSESIHGLSMDEALSPERADPAEVLETFLDWLPVGPVILAGLTPGFDRAFLRFWMQRHGKGELFARRFPHRTIDLHTLAVHYAITHDLPIPDRSFHTDAIYEMLHLGPELKPHVALTGARKECQAIRMLLGLDPVPSVASIQDHPTYAKLKVRCAFYALEEGAPQ